MAKFLMCCVLATTVLFVNDDDDKKKDEKVNLKDVKCVVMGKAAAKASKVVETKQGKLYMCCGNCVKSYNKNPEKYTAAANAQMVQTGQYVQKSCPFSGGKLNDKAVAKIGKMEIKMCCGNCVKKVDSAKTDADKVALVFSKKAFEKGFAKKEEKKEKKEKK